MVAPCRGGPIPGSTRIFSLPPARHSRRRHEDARLKEASSSRPKGWENGARWHLPENGIDNCSPRPEAENKANIAQRDGAASAFIGAGAGAEDPGARDVTEPVGLAGEIA
ncbi:unnamed protein product [Rangifer tarandus platyrhynchus]|uniref:Uncharacterized protein n=1 Tax=Rangifer tarandus platyrhynchus TaxID=3082113 RepID=A0ABN8Z9Q9_RANTA|nr:unnamed protein product [Rangifer tarandus platyrhynchus]